MSNLAIHAENIGKAYLVGHNTAEKGNYHSLRDALASGARDLARKTRDMLSGRAVVQGDEVEEFWALKDLNFEIHQGDRVGIIGRNGAGKSTLLKLLSRITEPTTGRIAINGKVASLLEVGTGFHPELTGRENIYLNGAILGMSQTEVRSKFDEIVDFAGVEKFLDTPVKRYSSGMYVRLAFAVAAHLETDILVVDEVLAVGDAEFQKKCMGKMDEVGKSGRTVLFVSHNMNAIEKLCSSAIVLRNGRQVMQTTDVRAAIHEYLSGSSASESSEWWNREGKYESNCFRPDVFRVTDANRRTLAHSVANDSEFWVEIVGVVDTPDPALTVGYALYTEGGDLLYWSYPADAQKEIHTLPKGKHTLRSRIPSQLLNEGRYRLELIGGLHYREWLFKPDSNGPQVFFEIQGGLSNSPYWLAKRPGTLAPVITWECE